MDSSARSRLITSPKGIVKIEVIALKFIDEVYDFYKNLLTGDEEDVLAIVIGLLEEHGKEDLLKLVKQMSEDELYHMLVMYMVEMLRVRMVEEGIGGADSTNNVH